MNLNKKITKLEGKRARRMKSLRRNRKKARSQRAKFQATGKRGFLVASKANAAKARSDAKAIRKLNKLISKLEERLGAIAKRPSPNFRWREFYCNDGTPFPESAKPHIRRLCREVLEPLRREYGAVTINSAYRHSAYNAAIGGVSNSYHVYDYRGGRAPAVDITCARGNPDAWAATAAQHGADGIGIYRGSNFTHIDQRGYSSRWYG